MGWEATWREDNQGRGKEGKALASAQKAKGERAMTLLTIRLSSQRKSEQGVGRN